MGFTGFLEGAAILGVDPGKSGAVARLGEDGLEVRRDFKKLDDNAAAIRDLLRSLLRSGESLQFPLLLKLLERFSIALDLVWRERRACSDLLQALL